MICGSDAMSEIPRCGLRPLRIYSEKKYLSRSVRLNNNNITDLYGIPFILSSFLAQPSKLGWLDLSFNKITHIDVVLCELQELRVLYLHCNSIKDLIETDKLGQLRHLHTITMHGNAIEFAKDYRW
ncbi:unnamed protein product [Menidia menidia]|uniref:Leucine-rich repeat-containing protein 51 n=1 Tax=Menidia menidia TaxID=238744 RepID=A0A8S4B0H5_9TELE|nr:unnamed protein product [Menidia menidia]